MAVVPGPVVAAVVGQRGVEVKGTTTCVVHKERERLQAQPPPQLASVPGAGVVARHGQIGVAHEPHGLGDKWYDGFVGARAES